MLIFACCGIIKQCKMGGSMGIKQNVKLQQELDNWNNKITKKSLPRWKDLPEFEVYMDQVIMLMEKYLGEYFEYTEDAVLTPSMINNYVKLKTMPAPEKKKYSKVHLSYLIIICMLKPVMSIQDIHDIIEYKLTEGDIATVLDWFVDIYESQFVSFLNNASELLKSNEIKAVNDTVTASNLAFRMGIEASVTRNISLTLINKVKKENASLSVNKTSKTKDKEKSKNRDNKQ